MCIYHLFQRKCVIVRNINICNIKLYDMMHILEIALEAGE